MIAFVAIEAKYARRRTLRSTDARSSLSVMRSVSNQGARHNPEYEEPLTGAQPHQ